MGGLWPPGYVFPPSAPWRLEQTVRNRNTEKGNPLGSLSFCPEIIFIG